MHFLADILTLHNQFELRFITYVKNNPFISWHLQ